MLHLVGVPSNATLRVESCGLVPHVSVSAMVPQHYRRGHQCRIGNQRPLELAMRFAVPSHDGPWFTFGEPMPRPIEEAPSLPGSDELGGCVTRHQPHCPSPLRGYPGLGE